METYPYSYPDSHDSSPRSLNNESWEDQQPSANHKVKFMISYNGKILPRPHDNQLTYVGGETKILALDRTIRFSAIVSKLSSFTSDEISFKYQLPGEDLDALISVTNDEDLEHMMAEYDRLHRSSVGGGAKPARLRLFLFPVSNSNQSSFSGDDPKPNQQWFVDALNAVPVSVPPVDASSPPASALNPSDLLFGFEKQPVSSPSPPPAPVSVPVSAKQDVEGKVLVGSDSGSERGDPMYEMHRQLQDLQRLQIQEQKQQQLQLQQAMFHRSNEGNINLARANYEYYMPEKPAAGSVPATVTPAAYWQDRNTAVSGGYSDQVNSLERQQQQHVHQQQQQQIHQQQQQQQQIHQQQQQQQHQLYMISSQGYQAPVTNVRQVTGQVGHTGQGYYGVQMQQRVAQDVYREQPMYAMGPPQVQQQQQQQHPQMKMMMGEAGGGGGGGGGYTTQVGYDSTGRQVYYATPSAQAGLSATYQTTVNVDPRQAGQLNQESKVVKPPQASS